MQMTTAEIRTLYRDAKDKVKIIKILSELNTTSPSVIHEMVKDLSPAPVKPPRKKRSRTIDLEQLRELHGMGYNDKEISLRMDIVHGSATQARLKLGLPSNFKRQGRFWEGV